MSETIRTHFVPKPVRIWLFIGVVMVCIQIVIGGVTRLTDSGLSITEWAVIQGTIPPLNEAEWLEAFDKYKVAAKKQFDMIHADMTLPEFKVIFFWEYLHRLWARLMGFVFLVPFLFFLRRKWLPSWLIKGLGIVITLAILAAVFGWIMVASGLNDDTRTWVSAYKLVLHLIIGTALFAALFWIWLISSDKIREHVIIPKLKTLSWWVTGLIIMQILLGGFMAGMRAGLVHPYAFSFIEGERLWNALSAFNEVRVEHLINYEPHRFAKALVQVLHRGTAWLLLIFIFVFMLKVKKMEVSRQLKRYSTLLFIVVLVQFLLGILTVINSAWRIPVFWGAVHQAWALVLLSVALIVNFQFRYWPKKED